MLWTWNSPNIVRVIKWRRMRWAGHVARMGEERGVYRVLVGKLEGKRPLVRSRRRWVFVLTQYCAGDKMEKNEMGWACGAYG